MTGGLKYEQEQPFYEFRLDEVIPGDKRTPLCVPPG
jgi:hypothetical protein